MNGGPLSHPDWPAPPGVRAVSTTRSGGISRGAWSGFNLSGNSGDDPAAVRANREQLRALAGLPAEPLWLCQVHGNRSIEAAEYRPGVKADALVARRAGQVCAVLTADCLPVLLAAADASAVAAVHAGWRGLAAGIIESALERLGLPGERLLAWLGPAIGAAVYEVGPEVKERFQAQAGAAACFRPSPAGRWLMDLEGLARLRLAGAGVDRVFGGGWCTHSDPGRFFSHRRDGPTGRMASLIWLE